MIPVFKVFLSLSLSGSVLILVLLFFKYFFKNRFSRQWLYYIWLIAIGRLLLPFAPKKNLTGSTLLALDQTLAQTQSIVSASPYEMQGSLQQPIDLLTGHLWLIWLIGALLLLIRKVTVYQGFMRYIKAGQKPVTDPKLSERFLIAKNAAGVTAAVDLCVNPMVSSPMLTGLFRPCIIFPDAGIPDTEFHYTVLHELTHYKRLDLPYKWLVQLTLCLHWFNPLVHLMAREINNDCEFACDEAIIAKLSFPDLQNYGKTLLNAMDTAGNHKKTIVSVNLATNKQLLKERLGTIMNFRKKSKLAASAAFVFTFLFLLGSNALGAYTASATNTADPQFSENLNVSYIQYEPDVTAAYISVYSDRTHTVEPTDKVRNQKYFQITYLEEGPMNQEYVQIHDR